jgi:hypothetical protein
VKYLSEERKRYLVDRQKTIELRRAKGYSKKSLYNGIILRAPKQFSLIDPRPRRELTKLISNIKLKVSARPYSLITIDFTATELFRADALLLFRAELDKLSHMFPGVQFKCRLSKNITPKHRKVIQVLKQVKMLDFFKYRTNIQPTYEDVINWEYVTGIKANGEDIHPILSKVRELISAKASSSLWIGVSEAMTNCAQHAYIDTREDGMANLPDERWWAFSHVRNGVMSVVFCDLGVGIPRTLPTADKGWYERLRSTVAGPPSEGQIIKWAMEEGASRTEKPNRGKGLVQVLEFVQQFPQGELTICSNKGYYMYRDGRSGRPQEYSDSVLATIFFWVVPLPKATS